ncbi:MAG: anaerobic ribonucleoside-triphosphate reductase activating protein [Patescibacteria group bacterium]|jgi:pyruvate formate lyase activating enzyme
MLLGGLEKTTLVDYPGKVACTVFTVGCNFACPFCHNKDILSREAFEKSDYKQVKEEDFFNFLSSRQKILDGVCITGGEPTLQKDLVGFCQKIKDRGLALKLDTNGSRPEIVKKLITAGVVDYFALDYKISWSRYAEAVGVKFPSEKVQESFKLVLDWFLTGSGQYDFRTTVVPSLHNEKELLIMANQLKAFFVEQEIEEKDRFWALQSFRPQNCLDNKFSKLTPFSYNQEEKFLKTVQEILPQTIWRGRE